MELAQYAATIGASDNRAATSEVFVTGVVYDALPPMRQDYYSASEKVDHVIAHRRFPPGFQSCFVVSPMGSPDSEIRCRSDYVYETYIKPACDSAQFRPVRGEMMKEQTIIDDVKSALDANLRVVA